MENTDVAAAPSRGSLRWAILRRAMKVPPSPSLAVHLVDIGTKDISRKRSCGFNLIFCDFVEECQSCPNEVSVCYKLPIAGDPKLVTIQRLEDHVDLDDFRISNRHDIDTTGLVRCWPSEDVLAYFCVNRREIFSSKRVIELGSGYGLAGLAVAACSEASEVVISDGNPRVVDYVQRSIDMNSPSFGSTKVKAMVLHWSQEHEPEMLNSFDVLIASDCTFFEELHGCLLRTIRSLLRNSEASEAILLGPRRGGSLGKFLGKIGDVGLRHELVEDYDPTMWSLHQKFLRGDDDDEDGGGWPDYDADRCYPLLTRITWPEAVSGHAAAS